MDLSLYHSLNDFTYRHSWLDGIASFLANDALFVLAALLALLWLARGRFASDANRHAILAAAFSAVLALVLNVVIAHLYDRARPFVHHAHHLLISHGRDASFPSDHTSVAFGIAFALLLHRRPVGWLALLVGVLIGVARVAVGVHYPTDVLASVGVGALAALVVHITPVRGLVEALSDALARRYERVARGVLGVRGAPT